MCFLCKSSVAFSLKGVKASSSPDVAVPEEFAKISQSNEQQSSNMLNAA